MRLQQNMHFFALALIFLAACTNFSKDKSVSLHQAHQKNMLSAAYLDSATSELFAHHTAYYDTSYRNPYGFGERDIVLYPDSIYERRIASISSALPLAYNEQVKSYIDMYAFRKKDLTERMLGKSVLYYPYIERLLRENDLPQELKLLTMIESALRPTAKSSKSAVGLWQIRYATGKWLGLTVNAYLDERRDPYASSEAGIQYLKKLYDMYGDWWLTIAAYNYGPRNLNKALVKIEADSIRDYWSVAPHLPRETRHYVPAMIAMVYLYHFQEEHNLRPRFPEVSFRSVDTVRIYDRITFDEIIQHTGVDKQELAFLNPAILRDVIPARKQGYRLVLPVGKMTRFVKNNPRLLKKNTLDETVFATAQVIKGKKEVIPEGDDLIKVIHTIRQGNTLDEISRYYGCTVQDLMAWNALYDPVLQIGWDLKIYIPQEQSQSLEASAASNQFPFPSPHSE